MRKVLAMLRALFLRRRKIGDDTKRLPSLARAVKALVPRSVMREVVESSHDRRQWGVLAAAWVGVSEREFMSAAARELRMAYQDGSRGGTRLALVRWDSSTFDGALDSDSEGPRSIREDDT